MYVCMYVGLTQPPNNDSEARSCSPRIIKSNVYIVYDYQSTHTHTHIYTHTHTLYKAWGGGVALETTCISAT